MSKESAQAKIRRLREMLPEWGDDDAQRFIDMELKVEDLASKSEFAKHPAAIELTKIAVQIVRNINVQLITKKGVDHLIDQKQAYLWFLRFIAQDYDKAIEQIESTVDSEISMTDEQKKIYLDETLI